MQSAIRFSKQPLGADGDWRRRLLLHYAPLALVSAAALVLFMALSAFDATKYSPGDLFSGTFPKEFAAGEDPAEHRGQSGPADPSGGAPPQEEGDPEQRFGGGPNFQHGGEQSGTTEQAEPEDPSGAAPQQGDGDHEEQFGGGPTFEPGSEQSGASEPTLLGVNTRRFTVASGYVALVLLGLTLLVGPANLMLRRRRPVSNYLARDVGYWAAGFSVIHVIYGIEVHASITDPIPMFVSNRSLLDPLTNSFGLANWTGLAATVLVVGLLAISSNYALGKLKARTWKNLQRLNYVLFALVIVHAFFYGALLRMDSPFTLLLIVGAVAVFIGQSVGVWLWRQRYPRGPAVEAA